MNLGETQAAKTPRCSEQVRATAGTPQTQVSGSTVPHLFQVTLGPQALPGKSTPLLFQDASEGFLLVLPGGNDLALVRWHLQKWPSFQEH